MWTVGALLVGAYLGYALAAVLLHVTGTDSTANVTSIAGGCGFIAGIAAARSVYLWRS